MKRKAATEAKKKIAMIAPSPSAPVTTAAPEEENEESVATAASVATADEQLEQQHEEERVKKLKTNHYVLNHQDVVVGLPEKIKEANSVIGEVDLRYKAVCGLIDEDLGKVANIRKDWMRRMNLTIQADGHGNGDLDSGDDADSGAESGPETRAAARPESKVCLGSRCEWPGRARGRGGAANAIRTKDNQQYYN